MGEYEIGRDLQELRSRVERLEAFRGDDRIASGRPGLGVATFREGFAGAAANSTPVHWKGGKREHVPPFVYSLLDLPLTADVAAESVTWPVVSEPWVQTVNWDGGGSDEFFRFQNQSVTKTKWTNPNTGEVNAVAQYNATLVASGKGQDAPNTTIWPIFYLDLLNAQGGFLYGFNTIFGVKCGSNYIFACGGRFAPGLYDLVSSGRMHIDWRSYRIAHC